MEVSENIQLCSHQERRDRCVPVAMSTMILMLVTSSIFTSTLYANTVEPVVCREWENVSQTSTESEKYLVGNIKINPRNLFDTSVKSESRLIHRLANTLHLKTRKETINTIIPIQSGDYFSLEDLEETERILRDRRYLYDASVEPVRVCGNKVDINVTTIDNWTFTPSISFGSAGGQNVSKLEIQDNNFLGFGKQVKLAAERKSKRTEISGYYLDSNFLGTQQYMRVEYSKARDETISSFRWGKPFYSSKDKHSWTFDYYRRHKSSRVNSSATDVDFREQTTRGEWLRKVESNLPGTLRIGPAWEFNFQDTTPGVLDDRFENSDFSEHSVMSVLDWNVLSHLTIRNYNSMGKQENVDVGFSAVANLGLVVDSSRFRNRGYRFDWNIVKRWNNPNNLLSIEFGQNLNFGSSNNSRSVNRFSSQWYYWPSDNSRFLLGMDGATQKDISPFHNLSLGGEKGLKGYPNGHQSGTHRIRTVAEYRHMFDWNPWRLSRVGATTFYESGRAWVSGGDSPTMSNIGAGLVFAPTRSSNSDLVRFEVAWPLSDNNDISAYQIFIGAELRY